MEEMWGFIMWERCDDLREKNIFLVYFLEWTGFCFKKEGGQ